MAGSNRAPLLLIHGDQGHLVDDSVRQWRSHIRATQLDVEVFDSPVRLADLARSISEIPLIDPERAVLVRDPPQLSGPARRGADSAEALAALLQHRAPSTSICIATHVRVAPSNPVLAAVTSLGGSVVYHPQVKRGRELRAWLERDVSRRGLRLGPGSLEHLMQCAGTDLGAMSNELDKLQALADGGALTTSQVQRSVAGGEPTEMYAVVDELLSTNPARGAAHIDALLDEGRSTQHLIAILGGQLRDLLQAQAHLATRGSAGLAAALAMPEWRAERLARQARAVPPETVMSWLAALHDADRRVKLGEIGDQDVLRVIGLRAASDVSATRAGLTRSAAR